MENSPLRRHASSLFATLLALGAAVLAAPSGRAQTAATPGVPAGYTLAADTAYGKKFLAHKTGAASLSALLQTALRDLGKVLDAQPTPRCAFADARVKGRGGASFTGALDGRPIKGLVLCSSDDTGADIVVTYCRAEAPAAAWEKLQGAQAPAGATGSGGQKAAANIRLEPYAFPDGTGTVGLPEGWRTSAQSVIQGVSIEGPAGQTVLLGLSYSVSTPDSFIVQNQMQLAANAQRMGLPPPPAVEMLVAPYTGPVEALWNLVPQLSQMSLRRGGPATQMARLLEEPKPLRSNFPNGQAASAYFAFMRTVGGRPVAHRGRALLESWPVGPGAWSLYVNHQLAAPDATFDADLPVMVAIAQSLKTNSRAVQQATGRAIDASNRFTQSALAANAERQAHPDKARVPVLLKIAPDLTWSQIDTVLDVIATHGLDGIIATNTTLERPGFFSTVNEAGGLSGRPLTRRSTEIINYISRRTQQKLPIIGVGGINDVRSAAEKLDAGATLVQLYTGMIYRGPFFAREVARGLSDRDRLQG